MGINSVITSTFNNIGDMNGEKYLVINSSLDKKPTVYKSIMGHADAL